MKMIDRSLVYICEGLAYSQRPWLRCKICDVRKVELEGEVKLGVD